MDETKIKVLVSGASHLWNDTRGASAIMLVLMMTSLFGIATLAISAGSWFSERRSFQTAADAAALAGAYDLRNGVSMNILKSDAQTEAINNGAPSMSNVTINSSPQFGSHQANTSSVEAIVSGPTLSGFMTGVRTIYAHATASITKTIHACGIALSANGVSQCAGVSGGSGVCLQGSAMLQLGESCAMPSCGIVSNDTGSTDSIHVSANNLCANAAYAVGGVNISGSSVLPPGIIPMTGQPTFPDPYTGFQTSLVATNITNVNCGPAVSGANQTISPPVAPKTCYDNFKVTGGTTLLPGTYIITDPDYTMGTVSGTGITVILATGDGNGAHVPSLDGLTFGTITAPRSGPYQGLVLFRDARATARSAEIVTGNIMEGIFYAPEDEIHFRGATKSDVSGGCLIIAVGSIELQGDSTLDDRSCPTAYGISAPYISTVALTE